MRSTTFALILLFTASADAQQLRLFGEVGSEIHVTPPDGRSSLNPDNVLNIDQNSDSSDMTLFGDLSSKNKRWKLQTKLRGAFEWRNDSTSSVAVDELGFNYGVTSWLDLRVGRKIERWGTGYAWNPTGVLNPRKDPADPGDRRRAFRGVDMLGADLFVKGWDFTVLVVPDIARSDAPGRRLRSTGWAARGYRLIHGTDVALTASGGNGLPNSQGLSVARVFGNALELHGEAAYIRDHVSVVPRDRELVPLGRPHTEVLIGGQYTFRNNVNVIAEWYYDGQGLSGREWRDFADFARRARESLVGGDPSALVAANARFTPLGMAKSYAFARVLVPIRLNRLELETIVISSLRDGSSLARPGLTWRVRPNWSLYWIQSEFLGGPRTEFGHIPIRRSTDVGIRYHFSLRETRAP